MKKAIGCFLFVVILPCMSQGQEAETQSPELFGMTHLTEYLGLLPDDISFRQDYLDPDEFRLKTIAQLMNHPWGMIEYSTGLRKAHVKTQPEILARLLFDDIARVNQTERGSAYRADMAKMQQAYSLFYTDFNLNQLLFKVALHLDVIFPRSTELVLSKLTSAQRKFLHNEFKELVITHEEEEFFSVEAVDSVEKAEIEYAEQFAQFGLLIEKDAINMAGIQCLREIMPEIKNLKRMLNSGNVSVDQILQGSGYIPDNADTEHILGRQPGWAIGGKGNDYYQGDYKFILDLGGDDVYDLSYDPSDPHGVIIIDLSGNDAYRSKTDFTLGSGCFSVGLLLDMGGDDRYDAKSFGLGAAFFGFGLLYDAAGDDRYDGDTFVQGAGCFGIGLLIDDEGRDIYSAASSSQGFGFVEGIGMLYDSDGSDTYTAGGKYKEIFHKDLHYYSTSQGYATGVRPILSGGIGTLVDVSGNDTYSSDFFAQGSSYWWSMGMLYDISGNDNYQSFQYSQGCGTHMTLGALIDDEGNDVYSCDGLAHGCGHDYSAGILLDRKGNDTYIASGLSQGAGSANGAGIMIDIEGDDRYFIKNKKNSQGYGNPRREFGSIGLFIDLGGVDQYAGNGTDNSYWRTNSKWGGGMDIEMVPTDSTEDKK